MPEPARRPMIFCRIGQISRLAFDGPAHDALATTITRFAARHDGLEAGQKPGAIEAAFRCLNERGGVSVKIGRGDTCAHSRLSDPAALVGYLAALAGKRN